MGATVEIYNFETKYNLHLRVSQLRHALWVSVFCFAEFRKFTYLKLQQMGKDVEAIRISLERLGVGGAESSGGAVLVTTPRRFQVVAAKSMATFIEFDESLENPTTRHKIMEYLKAHTDISEDSKVATRRTISRYVLVHKGCSRKMWRGGAKHA
jgi:hypothetical protein